MIPRGGEVNVRLDYQHPSLKHIALSLGSFWKVRRRTMALFTAYLDEGGHEHDPYFVMGGLALDVDKIEEFENDWLAAINNLPIHPETSLPFLHTTDFMTGEKKFTAWKGRYDEKAIVLTNVARVICKHSVRQFTCVLDMKDYSELNEEIQLSEAVGMPYSLLARFTWEMVRAWKYRTRFTDPVAMMLEDRKGGGDVYELFVNDNQPVPLSGSKTLPALQAADYITWMRQQKISPSNGYSHVRKSWGETCSYLHDDYTIDRRDLNTIRDETEKLGEGSIPIRGSELQTRFVSNIKRIRPRFRMRD